MRGYRRQEGLSIGYFGDLGVEQVSTSTVLVSGGRLVDPANGIHGRYDVRLRGSEVEEVAPDLGGKPGDLRIDARDCLVMPGLVDTHVHLCRPFGGPQGHRMLAKAGVTCTLDMAGDGDDLLDGLRAQGAGISVAYVYPLIPGETVSGRDPGQAELVRVRDRALANGALGIKILGGHFPLSADATARAIRLAGEARCWCAVHAGTLDTGSDIEGLEELVDLAAGLPVHVAHVNSYCRGQRLGDPLLEASRAIAALAGAPQMRSESYLATINGADATIVDGVPKSNVVKTCLDLGGFPATAEGMEAAIGAGWARIHGIREGETVLLSSEDGMNRYRETGTMVGVSFPVNPPEAAIAIALAKRQGEFVVTALSTDGGAIPRNTTLKQGLALVAFGALSLDDLVRKACYFPAVMLGLPKKGRLNPGADADLVVVDPVTAIPRWVIANGEVIVHDGEVLGRGGRLVATQAAKRNLELQNVEHALANPGWL